MNSENLFNQMVLKNLLFNQMVSKNCLFLFLRGIARAILGGRDIHPEDQMQKM